MSRIPENDALGVTVVLLTCSYRAQEFIRVGYFINNEYKDQEMKENPPSPPQFENVNYRFLPQTCAANIIIIVGAEKYSGVWTASNQV